MKYKLFYGYHKRNEHDNNVIKSKTIICDENELLNEISLFEKECGGRGDGYTQEPFAWIDLQHDFEKELEQSIKTNREQEIYKILKWDNVSYYDRLEHIYAQYGMEIPNDKVQS